MFERFTEPARLSVFRSRYEAGQAGSPFIETEHLLLGILRTDPELAARVFNSAARAEQVYRKIEAESEKRYGGRAKAPSQDLPLSDDSRRALAHGEEAARRLKQRHIGTEHLLFGLLREERSEAAKILAGQGITELVLEDAVRHAAQEPLTREEETGFGPDPTSSPGPLIGREAELERVISILSRRSKHNAALIGEPGIGKTALIEGLARRIADGAVPSLAEKRVRMVDAAALISPRQPWRFDYDAILAVEGLFDLAKSPGWAVIEAMHVLDAPLAAGARVIATGSPAGFGHTLEKAGTLAGRFEVVRMLPPTEQEAAAILLGVKPKLEEFHKVAIAEETIRAALLASRRFLPGRQLPDRALDLLDEAAARVKLRRGTSPVSPEDIEEAVAARTGATLAAVKSVLAREDEGEVQRLTRDLAQWLPAEQRDWAPFLAAHLAACSADDAEKLAATIRASKQR